MTRACFAALIASALTCGSAPAVAQTPAEIPVDSPAAIAAARDLFVKGTKASEENRWAEARERFEESLLLHRAPITLYSLGVAERQTGRWVAALAV
jgi:hypothetical protein